MFVWKYWICHGSLHKWIFHCGVITRALADAQMHRHTKLEVHYNFTSSCFSLMSKHYIKLTNNFQFASLHAWYICPVHTQTTFNPWNIYNFNSIVCWLWDALSLMRFWCLSPKRILKDAQLCCEVTIVQVDLNNEYNRAIT